MPEAIDILGVKINVTNISATVSFIENCISEKRKGYVCVAPVATVVDCQKEPKYKSVINESSMTTPDGMPLVWIAKSRGVKGIERTSGVDFMRAFFQKTQEKGVKHYFYGGSEHTLETLLLKVNQLFPKANIVGSHSPPILEINEHESEDKIKEINDLNPDVIWIGLGSPKQDYWMKNHREKLNAPVLVAVGAAFDFLAETKKRAPQWMQKSGLEWLFRLLSEPGRLWKRYLVGNSLFIYYLIRSIFIKPKTFHHA